MEPVLGYDVSDTAFGCDGKTMSPDQRDGASMVRRHPAPGGVGLSIVIPVYNEAAGLPALHARICKVAAGLAAERQLACEIVYVDDGSSDAPPPTALDCRAGSRPGGLCRATSARRRRCSPASITPAAARCCSWTPTASIRRR
jgi:hypothetical protein